MAGRRPRRRSDGGFAGHRSPKGRGLPEGRVGEHLNEATTDRLGSIPECGNTLSHPDCRATCTKQVGLCRRAHDQVTAAEQRLEQARRAVVTASDPQAAAFHVTSLELSSERAGELVWTLTVLPGLLDGMGLGNGTQAIMKPRAHRTLWTLVFATRLQRYDTLQEAQDERDRQWKRGVSCWVQPPLAAWGGNHRTSDHSQQGAAVVGTLSLRASAFAAGVVSF